MTYDAIVVGTGPNGLAAAITLAAAGARVLALERNPTPGGGLRSAELTLPGVVHDVGSAIHPFAAAGPYLRTLPLERHGLRWVHPELPLAHPLDDAPAARLERDLDTTAEALGPADGGAWRALLGPLVERWEALAGDILQPLLRWPDHPLALARFGLRALPPTAPLARLVFRNEPARALLAGLAAHANLPLGAPGTSAVALVLAAMGHHAGWPFPAGGAQRLTDALVAHLRELGGELVPDHEVTSLSELPPARAVLLDVTPRQLLALAGDALPGRYRRWLERYRYGAAAFKIDYALDGPIPWRDPVCARAGTVHLGGRLAEIEASERAVARGRAPERPYLLVAQHTPFDPSRAPEGVHTGWVYAHLPNGSEVDLTDAIEAQLERFAPGFRERVLARSVTTPRELEAGNPNLVGGDIGGGSGDLWQLLARPLPSPTPYATPLRGVYLCSAATPPGPGVHGMCGHNAARLALARELA